MYEDTWFSELRGVEIPEPLNPADFQDRESILAHWDNMDEDDLPERPYTKDELQAYLDYGRKKCQATIEALTDEAAQRRCRFDWGEVSYVELQLYSMRHVQEHAAQLSLMLGQEVGSAPDWVTKARSRAA